MERKGDKAKSHEKYEDVNDGAGGGMEGRTGTGLSLKRQGTWELVQTAVDIKLPSAERSFPERAEVSS
jgi:hypothetical protein